MKKFNLLQIVPSLDSGGVEQGTIDLANYLAKLEYNNLIVSNGGKLTTCLNNKFVKHLKLPVHSKNFLKQPFVAKKINSLIHDNNINILHIRSRAPAWLLPYIDKSNLKTVSTFHNVYGHQNIIKKIYNQGLSKTNYIVAISKYVEETIIKKYKIDPKKIRVINRGVDIDFFNSKINNESEFIKFLESKNITDNKKIILIPGRLTKWKGQLEFLEIIEKLKDNPYIFYFVGDDKNSSYKNKLLKQINKKKLNNLIKFFGHLNQNELKMIYNCADIVISCPLKEEGFGRTISESLLMKKIILAYNFGGAKNQLTGLDDIYKITPHAQSELINRIQTILNSSSENYNNLKEISRLHIVNNFSKQHMLDQYLNLYKEISN